MINRFSLQPSCALDVVVKNVYSAYFHDRVVYNTVVNVSDAEKAYGASHLTWKQWLTGSNMYKRVVTGKTFADTVKQNAYSHNNSVKNSANLEARQGVSRQGRLPGSVKEVNILRSTVSHQVKATHVRSC